MKKILILGATVNQLPFVKIAKDMGFYTITMDNVPSNISHKYADESVNISTVEKSLVYDYAKNKKVDAVLTCASDLALETTAYISEKMNLPFNKYDSVLKTVHKDLFRNFLIKNSFNTPIFYVFSDKEEAVKKINKLKNKWIIKPVDSSGSKGIYLLDMNKKNDIKFLVDNAFSFSLKRKIIVEEFIEGFNCSVDGFINNGKIDVFCITNKLLMNLPYRTPTGHTLPSKLNKKIQKNIKEVIKHILSLLDVKNSPFDFDIIVDNKNRIYILEMSLRIGGNGIPKLMFFHCGYDLYRSVLLSSLGINVPYNNINLNNGLCTGVYLMKSSVNGTLFNISNKKYLQSKYKFSLKEIVYDIKVGDKVNKFTQGNHRIGHFILQAKTKKDLKKLYKDFLFDLNVVVK